MRNERLDAILAEAKPTIAEHWASCLEAGLPDHSPAAHAEVDECLRDYINRLKTFPEPADQAAIMESLRLLFAKLDAVQQEYGEGLLETDERELLCPVIIDAAGGAGLKLDQFPNCDPTGEFRNF
jgi:hypothetical protein